jgi:hypothetical protein
MAGRGVGVGVVASCLVIACAAGAAPAAAETFSNPAPITTPSSTTGVTPATPYPSTISVSGLRGTTLEVRAHLTIGVARWADIDTLLVGPGGRTILLSDVCGTNQVLNVGLTFSDEAWIGLPGGDCVGFFTAGGEYTPSDFGSDDTFPGIAPPYPTGLANFRGISPNGQWQLYVVNDSTVGDEIRVDGWSLEINTARHKKCKKRKHRSGATATKKRCKKRKRR